MCVLVLSWFFGGVHLSYAVIVAFYIWLDGGLFDSITGEDFTV